MSGRRITRSLAQSSNSANEEVQAFYPFVRSRESSVSSDSEEDENNITIRPVGNAISPEEDADAEEESAEEERDEPPPIIMAQVTLKDALKVVPEFDGHRPPLSVFIEGCDEAKEMVGAANEPNLTRLLRSKLVGEARTAIQGQSFSTVEELKDFVKTIYAPAETVNQLLGEMAKEFQRDDETV
ncbi:hypothetical protein QAD02_023568 [Eretmocerus hayati]|uniref:Uncharacterized protein n=1 Tax=Eretmocerus hayati TaxID=131215 RepID=A0ACC2PVZ3_9HYME|nr:hypothetical protein QAD02_023568 [Eretmocerus hayati]